MCKMKFFIVFAIFAKITFAFEELENFVEPFNIIPEIPLYPDHSFSERIINGQNASPTQFPWHARILMSQILNGPPGFLCGGAIITDSYVLTAAHCIVSFKTFTLGFGSINLYGPGVAMVSSTAYVHPNYSNFTNDAGIIKLPKRLTFGPTIQAVRLPKVSQNTATSFVPVTCLAAGFGTTGDVNPTISLVLKWIELKTINNTVCAKKFSAGVIKPTIICSFDDPTGKKSVCHGDSGGALVYKESGIFTHIGITSFGSVSGCEKKYPNGYTRTASCLTWIKSVTNIVLRP